MDRITVCRIAGAVLFPTVWGVLAALSRDVQPIGFVLLGLMAVAGVGCALLGHATKDRD